MVTFGKHGTQSTLGWDVVGATQTLTVGRASQVGLSGGAPGGGVLEVRAVDPTVCTVHEQRRPPGGAWRDFSLLALKPGTTAVNASVAGTPTAHATMQVVVSGRADIRLVFYPGERFQSDTDVKGPSTWSAPAASGSALREARPW